MLFFVCLLSGCSGDTALHTSTPTATTHEIGGATMGTRWKVLWVDERDAGDAVSAEAMRVALVDELERINSLMSTWDPDSQLSEFNRSGTVDPVSLHPDTLKVIDTALTISRLTRGKYDITLQPVIDLWGFSRSDVPVSPTQPDIDRALRISGYQQLVRIDDTVRRRIPELSIDVSSLAKGFAVDQLGEVAESLGVTHYLVDIGGELRARGLRGDGAQWRVGVESPDGEVPQLLNLLDAHVATSGSYRNYRVENGQRLSHIIDGSTGRPITHDLVSVSVLGESAMLSDAWATALLVVGRAAALALVEQQGISAQLTVFRDGKFDRITRNGFLDKVMPVAVDSD